MIERFVGFGNQREIIFRIRAYRRNADTDRHRTELPLSLLDRFAKPLGHDPDSFAIRVRQNDRKLFPAVAGHIVAHASLAANDVRDRSENFVCRLMAETVIVFLELVYH